MSAVSLLHMIEDEKKSRANSVTLQLSGTQMLSSQEGGTNLSDTKEARQGYDSDDFDEDEILDALIRTEMGAE